MIITFSGIDGSGKTSACRAVIEELSRHGYRGEYCRPAYGVNDAIKRFCAREFGSPFSYIPNLDSSFYVSALFSDWILHCESVLSKHEGKLLVCDRYLYDVLAQAIHYGTNTSAILCLRSLFPAPDLSFFIAIDPKEAHIRLSQRLDPPIHHLESLENLEILMQSYERVKEMLSWRPQNVPAIDATQTSVAKILSFLAKS